MTSPSWLVQIYEMTDARTRDAVAERLRRVAGLSLEATESGPDHFLVVQCSDEEQATWIHRVVVASDVHAILLHTSHGPTPAVELAPYTTRMDRRSEDANGPR